jgi:Fe-S cluster biogenesis protein NfuA
VIIFEATPNPRAVKITLERGAAAEGGWQHALAATGNTVIAALEALDGVERVYPARDFVTIVCAGDDWRALRDDIAITLADLDLSAPSAPRASLTDVSEAAASGSDPVMRRIETVLAARLRPLLARDGGDAVLERFDPGDGTAWLRLEGACGGCPSSKLTLERGIETAIRAAVPEVRAVRAVEMPRLSRQERVSRFKGWIEKGWGSA